MTDPLKGLATPIDELPGSGETELPSDLASFMDPTAGEKAREVGIGLGEGVVRGGTLAGSIFTGARLGAMTSPVTGPAGPIIGGLGGLAYGLYAADALSNLFPATSNPELKPYREGAKTTGEGLGMAPLGFAIPAYQGASKLGQAVSAIGEYARSRPGAYLGKEAIASIYSGIAGGAAEEVYPGEAGPRFAAEVTAGIFGPGKFLFDVKSAAQKALDAGMSATAPDAASLRVADFLNKIVLESGDDPARLIRELDKKMASGLSVDMQPMPTAAQKAESTALSALERTLAKSSDEFGGQVRGQGEQTLRAYTLMIENLQKSGNPAALKAAATMRDGLLTDKFNATLANAQTRAIEVASRLGSPTSGSRADIGNILQGQIDSALREARSSERELWQKALAEGYRETRKGKVVPVRINPDDTKETFLQVVSTMTPERLRADFKDLSSAMGRFGIDDKALALYKKGMQTPEFLETGRVPQEFLAQIKTKNVPVQDVIALRSDLLDASRKAQANGETGTASILGRVSESLLDDLSKLPGTGYDNARAFSRELNNAFTRTFAGELDSVSRTGAERLPPELLVQKAFSAGTDQTLSRMRQIEEAAAFMNPEYKAIVQQFGPNSAEAAAARPPRVTSIRDAQAKAVRLMAAETVDPTTGMINANRLDNFRAKNTDLIKSLGLTKELSDVSAAQRSFLAIQDKGSAVNRAIRSDEAFAALLGNEDPARAVGEILKGKNPVAGIKSLADLARESGPEALDGLKSALYQRVFADAGGLDRFSVKKFDDALFKPISPNQPSLVNVMRNAGIMSFDEIKNMRRLINPMVRVEDALQSGKSFDQISPSGVMSPIEDLVLTQIGARLGGMASPGGPGSLSFAAKAIQTTKRLFSRMPAQQTMDLLREVVKDPEMTSAMLKRGLSQQEDRALSLGILRRLYSQGAVNSAVLRYLDEEEEKPPAESKATVEQVQRAVRPLPPAPPTRGFPSLGSKPPGSAPAAPSSQSRAMLQQLFPNDSVLAMAGQQPQPQPQP
jgi:hypothetical protein